MARSESLLIFKGLCRAFLSSENLIERSVPERWVLFLSTQRSIHCCQKERAVSSRSSLCTCVLSGCFFRYSLCLDSSKFHCDVSRSFYLIFPLEELSVLSDLRTSIHIVPLPIVSGLFPSKIPSQHTLELLILSLLINSLNILGWSRDGFFRSIFRSFHLFSCHETHCNNCIFSLLAIPFLCKTSCSLPDSICFFTKISCLSLFNNFKLT